MGDEVGQGGKSTRIPTRAFEFGVRVVKLCVWLDERPGTCRTLSSQIVRAATSIGDNVEEGQAAQSRADFASKYSIALKETRETIFRLRVLAGAELVTERQVGSLIDEGQELAAMLGAAIRTARRRRDDPDP